MASEKQIAANRRNAQLSTGPITREGKAASRLNALKSGLNARAVLLPGEDPTDLYKLCRRVMISWPDQHKRFMLEEIAVTQFEMARLRRAEAEVESFHQTPESRQADDRFRKFETLSKAKVRLQRHYLKCAAELQRLQQNDSAQAPAKNRNQSQNQSQIPWEPLGEPLIQTLLMPEFRIPTPPALRDE